MRIWGCLCDMPVLLLFFFFLDAVQKGEKAPDSLAEDTPPDVPTDKRIEIEAASRKGEWLVLGRETTTATKWSVSFFNHICKRQDLAAVARSPKVPESLRQSGRDQSSHVPVGPVHPSSAGVRCTDCVTSSSLTNTISKDSRIISHDALVRPLLCCCWLQWSQCAGAKPSAGTRICLRINTFKAGRTILHLFQNFYTSSLSRQ